LNEDLREIAPQKGVNIGLNPPRSGDQLRDEVIRTAAEHNVYLQPEQVKLARINYGERGMCLRFDLAVDYTVPVNLLFSWFNLRITQTSAK
jgi:hypothetical protein